MLPFFGDLVYIKFEVLIATLAVMSSIVISEVDTK
jgi:hypothetical protein